MKQFLKGAVASLAALPLLANAALPASVTTALTDGATDAGIVWAGILAVAVVGVVFAMGAKGVKKIPRAM
jgi:hypothetical protein